MQTHTIKSEALVESILKGVEEEHLVSIAMNVARHHHEKWNGFGYPDMLKGEDIPIEARIMAIADVYDALVSKRCYKEPMSFEKAAEAYLRLAELSPNDVEAWKGRGKSLLALDRAADAAGCFERALLLLPDDEELLTLLAEALDKIGDVQKKAACFVRLGELEAEK